MTMFGFVIAITIINTLFLFDLYVTRHQQRNSLWGATMTYMASTYSFYKVLPVLTFVNLWISGLTHANEVTIVSVFFSIVFCVYFVLLYLHSTVMYYVLQLHKK